MVRLKDYFVRRRIFYTIRQIFIPTCCLLAIAGLAIYTPPNRTDLQKQQFSGNGCEVATTTTDSGLKTFKHGQNYVRKLLLNALAEENNNNATEVNTLTTSSATEQSIINGKTVLPSGNAGNLTWVKRLPKALIIGVKKGGTRALLEFLRLHPDVRAPGPEVHFFDRFYDKGLDWYRNQMPASLPEQLTIEKTPSYFIVPDVPARVRTMSPNIKLIVVVRDPVTRAISDYTQALSKHPSIRSFENIAFLNVSTGLLDTSWSSIKIGVYAKHLERWLRHFPLKQIHFVSGEGLILDPVKELTKVQRFLNLDTVISEKHFYFNETKGFPCLKKSEGNGNPHCLGKTKGRIHAKIKRDTIQRLHDFYRPFNLKFYRMINQDFGWNLEAQTDFK